MTHVTDRSAGPRGLLPHQRAKLGLDLEAIRAANPQVIYAVGTGLGARGPDAEKGGYDGITFWGRGGPSASLSSGEVLDSEVLHFQLIDLDNVGGVGQDNASLFMGWLPVLSFAANLADLRARGVSIILAAEWRYDYQLEGESDLWLRNRPGSSADSVASLDNAATLRVFPGSVLSV